MLDRPCGRTGWAWSLTVWRLCAEGHRDELRSVMTDIGHFVRNNQVVLDIDGGLHVVANDSGALAAGRH
jgi:hypothetical protein